MTALQTSNDLQPQALQEWSESLSISDRELLAALYDEVELEVIRMALAGAIAGRVEHSLLGRLDPAFQRIFAELALAE